MKSSSSNKEGQREQIKLQKFPLKIEPFKLFSEIKIIESYLK